MSRVSEGNGYDKSKCWACVDKDKKLDQCRRILEELNGVVITPGSEYSSGVGVMDYVRAIETIRKLVKKGLAI